MAAFATYVTANAVALGSTAAAATELSSKVDAFASSLTAYGAMSNQLAGQRADKDAKREQAVAMVRQLVRQFQASTVVTDAQRGEMQINIRDTTRTPTAPGTTRPVGMVDTSQRLRHEIKFVDEATPTSRAKPAGAMGCELWVKIGDTVPAAVEECTFLALDSASPYVAEFGPADAGKKAHYLLRWVYNGGAKGPVSETVSATITG